MHTESNQSQRHVPVPVMQVQCRFMMFQFQNCSAQTCPKSSCNGTSVGIAQRHHVDTHCSTKLVLQLLCIFPQCIHNPKLRSEHRPRHDRTNFEHHLGSAHDTTNRGAPTERRRGGERDGDMRDGSGSFVFSSTVTGLVLNLSVRRLPTRQVCLRSKGFSGDRTHASRREADNLALP